MEITTASIGKAQFLNILSQRLHYSLAQSGLDYLYYTFTTQSPTYPHLHPTIQDTKIVLSCRGTVHHSNETRVDRYPQQTDGTERQSACSVGADTHGTVSDCQS